MHTKTSKLFAFSNMNLIGAVRLGRTGTKYHAASIHPIDGLTIHCSCAGTQQGAAYNKSVFIKDAKGTCKN